MPNTARTDEVVVAAFSGRLRKNAVPPSHSSYANDPMNGYKSFK